VFRVIAPLEDHVAAIALFNFTEGGKTISSFISNADYPHAGELLQPTEGPWALPKERLLIYDRDEKKVIQLQETITCDINNFGAKLFLLYPKTSGWAVIGRSDKYLPSAAVKIKSVTADKVVFTLKESGPLAVWSEKGTPKIKGISFDPQGNGLYIAELPIAAGVREMTMTR